MKLLSSLHRACLLRSQRARVAARAGRSGFGLTDPFRLWALASFSELHRLHDAVGLDVKPVLLLNSVQRSMDRLTDQFHCPIGNHQCLVSYPGGKISAGACCTAFFTAARRIA